MDYTNPAITTVMADLEARGIKAQQDPNAPVYHFRPLAGWMNDVNAFLHFNGYYHVFFQLHPYSNGFGKMYWGHARSKDLIYWERLPIAIWPSEENGEKGCWSGAAAITDNGEPIIFYTSVFQEGDQKTVRPFEQWAAIPEDDDLICWKKHPSNPIFTYQAHAKEDFGIEWRDPFAFKAEGRDFLVLYSEGGLPLYEAQNSELIEWKNMGYIFDKNFECPNFFPLKDKWVFITSAYEHGAKYYVGTFDINKLCFKPETEGVLDREHQRIGWQSLYGTNILFDDEGRCILLGRFNGFDNTLGEEYGWNGCMSLPRILTIDTDGRIIQTPHPDLKIVRTDNLHLDNIEIRNQVKTIKEVSGDTIEILIKLNLGDAESCGLLLYYDEEQKKGISISYDGTNIDLAGNRFAYQPKNNANKITFHAYLDKSLIELYIDDGRDYISHILDPRIFGTGIAIFAKSGHATVKTIDFWGMKSIW
jgi:beta-fructofuranosidase